MIAGFPGAGHSTVAYYMHASPQRATQAKPLSVPVIATSSQYRANIFESVPPWKRITYHALSPHPFLGRDTKCIGDRPVNMIRSSRWPGMVGYVRPMHCPAALTHLLRITSVYAQDAMSWLLPPPNIILMTVGQRPVILHNCRSAQWSFSATSNDVQGDNRLIR